MFKPTPVNPPFFPGPWPLFEAMPWPSTFRLGRLQSLSFRVKRRTGKENGHLSGENILGLLTAAGMEWGGCYASSRGFLDF